MDMDFLPLHVYTGYSFLRSGISLASFVALAKKRGQKYCCISDLGTMTGFPELASLCARQGMIPIYAMEAQVDGLSFIAVIQEECGYRNLIEIAYLQSEGKLTLDGIKSHQKGLRFILDLASPSTRNLPLNEFQPYFARISKGFDVFALGIPYLPSKRGYIADLRTFLSSHPYPALALPHIRYAKPSDAIALSIVEAISVDARLDQKKLDGDEYYLEEDILSSYYSEDELKATLRFVEGIDFTFAKKRGALPHFPTPHGESSEELLRHDAYEGLAKRIPNYGAEYRQRLEYELSVIIKMGYADYFLIVADYVNFARTHGISVGPGRGSGAGSLVSFALGIVTPDPLKYGLLFERFLNPERQSMPDIDIDFSDIRRDEVAHYLQEKYGHDRVGHIVTMQTLGAKASLRDVGRVFGYESRHIDMLAKSIGGNLLSLRENYKTNTAFRTLVDSDPYYLEIVSLAAKIEGLPRQAGLHAAGIVLSEEPLVHVIPVAENQGVGLVAQYEMTYLEEQGVLKMDLLGLRNLTLVDHCLKLIETKEGIKLDYATLPYEDKEAIKLIAANKTMGLFQLESAGMNRAIAQVKPTSFLDIVAIISLFRPGPMENIPHFARRKAGLEPITYPAPQLEPILKETYGIIVYQEQIMQIVTALAGFSYGQADLFRRAVSKKDATKLESLRGGFINGCLMHGVPRATAESVYELIYKFADYGFNKSHALVYAILACQMAYLKSRYPSCFYCTILDGTSSSDPKFHALIREIKRGGYRFALPSINKAGLTFLPEGKSIMFPLTAIKGIQGALAYKIVEEREIGGAYVDFFDFALRNKKNGLNVASFVRLVDAGCFDEFPYNRPSLRLAAERALNYAEMFAGESGQEILLALDFPAPEMPSLSDDLGGDLIAERDALGMMISGSPLSGKEKEIASLHLKRLSTLEEATREETYAAVVESAKVVVTKKGTRMCFATLYDEETIVEVVLFSEAYDRSYAALKEGSLVKASIYKNRNREGYCASLVENL